MLYPSIGDCTASPIKRQSEKGLCTGSNPGDRGAHRGRIQDHAKGLKKSHHFRCHQAEPHTAHCHTQAGKGCIHPIHRHKCWCLTVATLLHRVTGARPEHGATYAMDSWLARSALCATHKKRLCGLLCEIAKAERPVHIEIKPEGICHIKPKLGKTTLRHSSVCQAELPIHQDSGMPEPIFGPQQSSIVWKAANCWRSSILASRCC